MFYIVSRRMRVADYQMRNRGKAEILARHLAETWSLPTEDITVVFGASLRDAVRNAREHFAEN